MEPMQTGPQNRFSFFDRQIHVIRSVVKPGFSASILNNPFLTSTGFNPVTRRKTNRMNVLHRNYMKNSICRVSERNLKGVSLYITLICFWECQESLLNETASF